MNNHKQTILVTGAGGQLGNTFKAIAAQHPAYHFIFAGKEILPIENAGAAERYFAGQPIHYCINCAAYTAVDKAESEEEKAFLINATGAGNIAEACTKHGVKLIHISTDYVFDGSSQTPHKETDPTHPGCVYGASKLKGEELVMQHCANAIIIRTSWLYSAYGHNFVKTMLRLMKEKERIDVVDDQWGCPTYAEDLAAAIMKMVCEWETGNAQGAIFNYCNAGIASWHEFALEIKKITGSKCQVNPIPTAQYPTAAKRPQYSVLDTAAIQKAFAISIPEWRDSLGKCLRGMG